MRNRRLWQDTVAEIEDERAIGKRADDSVYAAIENFATRQQHQWIKIALHGNVRWNCSACKIQIHGPIEADAVNCNILMKGRIPAPIPRGKPMTLALGISIRSLRIRR